MDGEKCTMSTLPKENKAILMPDRVTSKQERHKGWRRAFHNSPRRHNNSNMHASNNRALSDYMRQKLKELKKKKNRWIHHYSWRLQYPTLRNRSTGRKSVRAQLNPTTSLISGM